MTSNMTSNVPGLVFWVAVILWRIYGRRGEQHYAISPENWAFIAKSGALVMAFAIQVEGNPAPYAGIPMWLGVFAFCMPMFALRCVVIPLGWPMLAFWMVRLCRPLCFANDTKAGGMFCAALALARSRASRRRLEWLARKVNALPTLMGTAAVAAGILAAVRGDRSMARCLLGSADRSPAPRMPGVVRVAARDWLVADAARAADWREAIRLGKNRKEKTRWSYAVACIAERLVGHAEAYGNAQLWLCWLLAPRRRATLPLLRRALQAAPRAKPPAAMDGPEAQDLPSALAGMVRLLAHRQCCTARTFADAVREVERQLDHPATRDAISQRLRTLASPAAEAEVIARLREGLRALLVPAIEACPHLAQGAYRAAGIMQAVEEVKRKLYRDIDVRCADYRARVRDKAALETYAEWRAWAELRDAAELLLRLDPDAERTLFQTVRSPLWNFAFQEYTANRMAMSHEVFSWLHRHARSDPDAAASLEKNARVTKA